MKKNLLFNVAALTSASLMMTACDKSGSSFSLMADSASYKQEAVYIPKKIDVLWVIDNSGSMATSQNNLASNFQSFIQRFQAHNYDFNMAVVTTDGWRKEFNSGSVLSRIRKGALVDKAGGGVETTDSGVYVMNNNTANLANIFAINIKQGTYGDGDERALDSMKQSLLDSFNVGLNFRREEAFLAVILVGDEEDGSWASESPAGSGSTKRTVQSFVDFLDGYTGGTANGRNYSVSSISVPDQACANSLNTDGFSRTIGNRFKEISTLTGGVVGSLCSNFGTTLDLISDTIVQLSSAFKLNREPIPETIRVTIDGVVIPNNSTNGWTYDAATLTITFHGSAVPVANSVVNIGFDPKTIKL